MNAGSRLRATGAATAIRIAGRATGFLGQLVLARLLAPESFGIFAIAWTVLRLYSIVGHLGLDSALIRFGSMHWGNDSRRLRGVFATAIGTTLISGVAFGLLAYVSAPWLAASLFKKPDVAWVLQGLAVAFPLAALLRVIVAGSSLSGNLTYGGVAEDVVQPVSQITLFVILLPAFPGLAAAVAATAMSYIIAVAVAAVCAARLVPALRGAAPLAFFPAGELLAFSLPALIGTTLGAFNLWGDRLLVGALASAEDAGIYQAASLLTMFSTLLISGLKLALAPWIASLDAAGDFAASANALRTVSRFGLYLSLPAVLPLVLAPSGLLSLAFGVEYAAGAPALLWLAAAQLLYVGFGAADQFFLMSGNQRDWAFMSAISVAALIVVDVLAIPRFGILGAGVASFSTTALLGLLVVARLRQRFGFWLVSRYHLFMGGAFLVAVGSAVLAYWLIPMQGTVESGVGIALALLILGTLVWVWGIHPDDRQRVRASIGRVGFRWAPPP